MKAATKWLKFCRRMHFTERKWCNLIQSSLKYIPKCPFHNNPAVARTVTWHLKRDKPLSEAPMAQLGDADICSTWLHWVKWCWQYRVPKRAKGKIVFYCIEKVAWASLRTHEATFIDFVYPRCQAVSVWDSLSWWVRPQDLVSPSISRASIPRYIAQGSSRHMFPARKEETMIHFNMKTV